MTIGPTVSVDPLDRHVKMIADLERRIATLERTATRAAALNSTKTFQVGMTSATIGFTALTTLVTLTVPAQPMVGTILVTADLRLDVTVVGDTFEAYIRNGATAVCRRDMSRTAQHNISMTGRIITVAGSANTITLTVARIAGTGTGTVYGEPADLQRLTAVFVPG